MVKNIPTILYLCIDPTLGGSTQSLLNLIRSLKEHVAPIVIVPEEGLAYDTFKQEKIECYVYPFLKLYELKKNRLIDNITHPWRWHIIKKIRFDYGCYRFVKKQLNGRKIDIVHSNTSPNDVGVLLAKKLKAKHVWHVREFCDLHFHFEIYKGIPRLRKLINSADARIAISTAIAEHWQMPTNNTWIINDACRSAHEISYEPLKEKYLLFTSYYLTEAKGTRTAIIAFAKSGLGKHGYTLKLMGNCREDYKLSLQATIAEYEIEDKVEFVPCQSDIKPYFEHASGYIMASECEGLGRVTAEAMFYGCPVVAHASGGTLDLVKDGITGYLFHTVDECADLINKVCNENQEKVILQAQQFAVEHLSQEVYGPKIMEVYESVLNEK